MKDTATPPMNEIWVHATLVNPQVVADRSGLSAGVSRTRTIRLAGRVTIAIPMGTISMGQTPRTGAIRLTAIRMDEN